MLHATTCEQETEIEVERTTTKEMTQELRLRENDLGEFRSGEQLYEGQSDTKYHKEYTENIGQRISNHVEEVEHTQQAGNERSKSSQYA